jgi:hypothetical protein
LVRLVIGQPARHLGEDDLMVPVRSTIPRRGILCFAGYPKDFEQF